VAGIAPANMLATNALGRDIGAVWFGMESA
jgi:hypothetical protein